MMLLLQSDAAKIKGFNEDLADETAVALQTENDGLHPGLSARKIRASWFCQRLFTSAEVSCPGLSDHF